MSRVIRVLAGMSVVCVLAVLLVIVVTASANNRDLLSGFVHLFESPHTAQGVQPQLDDVFWSRVSWVSDIQDLSLNESSGLAASILHPGVFWSINDSGSDPALFAIETGGQTRGVYPVDTQLNADWESLGAFEFNGTAYLAIGDTGDNFRWRRSVQFLVVPEPRDLAAPDTLNVAWTVEFTYPDGPRDSEASAVDVAGNRILMLSKRRHPPELFAVPLRSDGKVVMAELLGELTHFPLPTQAEIDREARAAYRHMPSGMDLLGNMLLITTYKHAYVYSLENLAAAPLRIPLPSLGQREAIAFARHASSPHVAYISKERLQRKGVADLFRIEFTLREPHTGDAAAQTPPEDVPSG